MARKPRWDYEDGLEDSNTEYIEDLLENDEISTEEAAFMQGYNQS